MSYVRVHCTCQIGMGIQNRQKPSMTSHFGSEQICLLHDPQELFFIYLAITIAVGLVDHLLQLLICHPLAELLGNALQILEGDLSSLIVIEEPECLQDLVL